MGVVLFTLPLLGDITLGTAIGVLGTIASFLLAKPHSPTIKAMTSAWGETWPITYNHFRVPGKVIQAGELNQVDVKLGPGKKTQNYSLTFAVGICEGPVVLGRIWADNQVIYDPRAIANPPDWQANHLYAAGDQIFAPGHTDWIFTATNNGLSGSSQPAWNFESDGATRDLEVVWLATKYRPRNKIGKQYNFYFTFYDGSEDQLPDTNLEEIVGVGNQPAYRGVAYVVFISFDLTRYGNRIPNFEFEVLGSGNNSFITGAQLYGTPFADNATHMPMMADANGDIYGVSSTSLIANIKTLATSTRNVQADAIALGFAAAGAGWDGFTAIGDKYCLATNRTSSPATLDVVLYEVQAGGTLNPLGCRSYSYTFSSDSLPSAAVAGIYPSTGEVIVGYPDFSSVAPHVIVLDTIAHMTGGYAVRPRNTRFVQIAEITGSYGFEPGPYIIGTRASYCMTFVGNDVYFALNSAHMEFIRTHSPGDVGYNTYYASLEPTHPNGVMIKAILTSDSAGNLTYQWIGPTSDFGWPFADEGLTKAGGAGHLSAPTYDAWSPPMEEQDDTGTVLTVSFTRGYSDAPNQIGFKEFVNGALTNEVDGAPFDASFSNTMTTPYAMFIAGGIYLTFASGGIYFAKIGAFDAALMTLADICADVSRRVGLTDAQLNYTGLETVIPAGAALLQRDTARSFIESMQPAYFFDLTDIGLKIVGSLRRNDFVAQVIPQADLAAVPGGTTKQGTVVDMISSVRNDDLEIPKDLSITYYDSQHDYQQGSQQARRGPVTQYSSGKNTVSVPVVMTPYEANAAAQRGLFMTWVERIQRKFILPPEYLARTAVDVVEVQRDLRNYIVRITRITIKQNWTLEVESVSEDLGTYAITGTMPITSLTSGAFSEQTIDPVTQPVLAVMDTATLQQSDLALPGVYVAAANSDGGKYDTVTVQESPDNSVFSDVTTLPNQSAMGTVAVALGAPTHYAVWDSVNTLTVSLLYGTLASADKWALTADLTTNLAWLSNGEIVQYATATLNGDGTYTLSGLRRGRLGTEQFVGTHGADETFVALNDVTLGNVTYSPPDIGATRYWQGLNDAPVNPASEVQTLTMTTRRLMPYAPTFIKGSRDGSHNLTITGLRRVRWHGQSLWHPAETDTPVTVEIDVLNGSTVVRTLTSSLSGNGSGVTDANGFTAYYAAADQVIDFGSAQASVSLKAYSRNATVGRGYPGARSV